MKQLFGTDGIRGEAGEFPLDKNTISTIGESLVKQFEQELGRPPKFLTGRDTRESGVWIENAFANGAKRAGAEVYSAGIITTPGVAYLTRIEELDAGIVISASHNPFVDNGLKVFLPSGKKIDENVERKIEHDIYANPNKEFGVAEDEEVNQSRTAEFSDHYLDGLKERHSGLNLSGLRLLVDCANGAAYDLAPKLFEGLGAKVIAINNSPDGRNINLNCGSLHLDVLQEAVLRENADFGVAFDGDADRSLFVDEKGKIVDGDATLWVLAKNLQENGKLNKNIVVATVMSNIGLERALSSKGMTLLRTSVGDKYVLRSLLENDGSLGGEQSGHIILPKRSLVGDGMETALSLLQAVKDSEKSISELVEGFTQYPQILVNVRVGQKKPFEEIEEIARAKKVLDDQLGENGRLLLRYSGTENLARVMIEGEDQEEIEKQANELAEVIKDALV